jgi:hypothetical protein
MSEDVYVYVPGFIYCVWVCLTVHVYLTSNFIILCRIRQGARHIVSEIANQGYDLQGGVFLLPHVNIIYTPQCFAEVVFARKQVEHELEEHAIEAMEVVFAQPLGVLACLYALI